MEGTSILCIVGAPVEMHVNSFPERSNCWLFPMIKYHCAFLTHNRSTKQKAEMVHENLSALRV